MTPWEEYLEFEKERKRLESEMRELARSMGADYVEYNIVNDEGLSAAQYRALARAMGKIISNSYRLSLALEMSRQPEEGN